LLELFPTEVGSSIGPWLPRIAALVGPLRERRETRSGLPDGFQGIARRGPYERLLLSEWALAEEAPDEFTRRAAMSEHHFLELLHRTPSKARSSLALFNQGPDQLGSPRLAHLALLFVLAERAALAHARFRWGLLQDPERRLFDGLEPVVVHEKLLGAGVAKPTSDEDRRAVLLRARQEEADDLWLVGESSFSEPRRASLVDIQDVLDPERRSLSITVRSAAAERALEIDLPSDESATRLLRDPFTPRETPPRPPAKPAENLFPNSTLLFSPHGRKVYARQSNSVLVAYPVPTSHRQIAFPTFVRLPDEGRIVAITRWGRHPLVLVAEGRRLDVVWRKQREAKTIASFTMPVETVAPVFSKVDALRPMWAVPDNEPPGFWLRFVDDAGDLWSLNCAGHCARSGVGVAALTVFDRYALMFASRAEHPCRGEGLVHSPGLWRDFPGSHQPPTYDDVDFTSAAFIAVSRLLRNPEILLAYRDKSGRYAVRGLSWPAACDRSPKRAWQAESFFVNVNVGTVVAGVAIDMTSRERCLVTLSEDRRRVELLRASGPRVLYESQAPITDIAVSHTRPEWAMCTSDGEILVQSFLRKQPLFRVKA
jgi:hypothetical protein